MVCFFVTLSRARKELNVSSNILLQLDSRLDIHAPRLLLLSAARQWEGLQLRPRLAGPRTRFSEFVPETFRIARL
jgi:hypothetical protein